MFPKNKIRPLQSALKELGLYLGKIDGVIGPLTIEALNKLEESYNTDSPKPVNPIDTAEPLPSPELDNEGSTVEDALKYSLKNEGGFVNHPADKGGATNMGITIGTLSAYLGKKATVTDVKNLTHETVADIYRERYFNPMGLSKIVDQSIATALFDMG